MTYFDVPYFSNSYLSKLEHIINGEEYPERDASFFVTGREFEDCLLYNKKTDSRMIKNMVLETNKNSVYLSMINHPNVKIQHEFYGRRFDLPFKAKADMVIKGFCVPDIKTTSCTTLDKFEQSILDYSYHRQMYIYMEAFKCDMACLIGIQKSMNPKIFTVFINRGDELYNLGKRKTENLVSIVKSLYVC
jgi:hypothetical protein